MRKSAGIQAHGKWPATQRQGAHEAGRCECLRWQPPRNFQFGGPVWSYVWPSKCTHPKRVQTGYGNVEVRTYYEVPVHSHHDSPCQCKWNLRHVKPIDEVCNPQKSHYQKCVKNVPFIPVKSCGIMNFWVMCVRGGALSVKTNGRWLANAHSDITSAWSIRLKTPGLARIHCKFLRGNANGPIPKYPRNRDGGSEVLRANF